MAYSDLSDDDKAAMQAFTDVFRPLMGETARLFARLARLEDAWAGGVLAIVGKLSNDDVIETNSNLAGTSALTKASIVKTMGDFQYALSAFNSDANRQRYIAAAGLPNVI